MNDNSLYIKYSKDRIPEFDVKTRVWSNGDALVIHKIANSDSKKFINSLVSKYNKIRSIETSFKILPAKLIDEYTVEFPYINGQSLLESLTQTKSAEKFTEIIERYINLLKSLPQSSEKLSKEFEDIFGKGEKRIYKVLNPGILDITLENLIEDKKNDVYLIDYEWTFDFSIPVDYIVFRTLLIACSNSTLPSFASLDSLLDKYVENKESIEEFKMWELQFQRYVSSREIPDDGIENLMTNGKKQNCLDLTSLVRDRYTLEDQVIMLQDQLKESNNINSNLKEKLINVNEDVLDLKSHLNKEFELARDLERRYEILTEENCHMSEELINFDAFKKGLIWRFLMFYRKIKKKFFYYKK